MGLPSLIASFKGKIRLPSSHVHVPVLSLQILTSYSSVSQSEIPSQGMINYHVFHRISQSCLPARGRPFAIANTMIMTSSDNTNKCIEICWCCPSLNTSTLMSPLFRENFSNRLDCLKLQTTETKNNLNDSNNNTPTIIIV